MVGRRDGKIVCITGAASGFGRGAALALALRVLGRLLAKRFAWTCLALFAAALLSLKAVDESRHPGAIVASERSAP